MELVIATGNVHKFRELQGILRALLPDLECLSLHHFPDYQLPEETGTTFVENAELKAIHAGKALDRLVLADDSGLVIPALDGQPGVFSARYAGPDATDADNRKKLLTEMASLQNEQRQAQFVCSLALADPSGSIATVTGTCEGTILPEMRGGSGFGYDPLFLKHDYGLTFAELESSVKDRVSHRRKAAELLQPQLENAGLS